MSNEARILARVHAITYNAEGVLLFDLRSADGQPLPEFSSGAHIDLVLGDKKVRSYSLLNSAADRSRYVIGVKREPLGRGGSRWLHDVLRPGDTIEIVGPRNSFALCDEAPFSIFFAGGIGITPLWSMIQRLEEQGQAWSLYYRARERRAAPLLDLVEDPRFEGKVHVSIAAEGDARFDFAQIVASSPPSTHFYCCGPSEMLSAFQSACANVNPAAVHSEHFASDAAPASAGGYTLLLGRSGRSLPVPAGQTILECLSEHGVSVPSSCQQGVCGACETRVLSGTPDHRDLVLSEDERRAGKTMMICCSGSLSETLELDL